MQTATKPRELKDMSDGVTNPKPGIRQFGPNGGNRNSDEGKLDYEGFNSPLVDLRYAEYMHENRYLEDGTIRDSDNWQKGIPKDVYRRSLRRHWEDVRLHHEGYGHLAKEPLEKALCGVLFNAKGYLFEVLKAKHSFREVPEPTEKEKQWIDEGLGYIEKKDDSSAL